MSREIIIRVSKCMLVISEVELMNALAAKPDVFEKAIRRGKSLLRSQSAERRQNQVDRWRVYEWLKGHRIPDNAASLVESMAAGELREGVIEFLLQKQRGNA